MSRSDRPVQFGPNEWLVEEMYEQFLADPSMVDSFWRDFFADYRPAPRGDNGNATRADVRPLPEQRPANSAAVKERTAVGAGL